jgi:hypothetical protein
VLVVKLLQLPNTCHCKPKMGQQARIAHCAIAWFPAPLNCHTCHQLQTGLAGVTHIGPDKDYSEVIKLALESEGWTKGEFSFLFALAVYSILLYWGQGVYSDIVAEEG